MLLDHPRCPLCSSERTEFYHRDKQRSYLQCAHCDVVFVDPAALPTLAQERAQYDLHNNNPNDIGYRRFLSRLLDPLQTKLKSADRGLDFGCGPGPSISVMMAERGWQVDNYDPYYFPALNVFSQPYNFICCTEVLEHIHWPMPLLDQLWQNIRPGGVFGIMTKRVRDRAAFANWHYKNDPTHVRFYSETSLNWLAQRWQADIEFADTDVVIFQKKSVANNDQTKLD